MGVPLALPLVPIGPRTEGQAPLLLEGAPARAAPAPPLLEQPCKAVAGVGRDLIPLGKSFPFLTFGYLPLKCGHLS